MSRLFRGHFFIRLSSRATFFAGLFFVAFSSSWIEGQVVEDQATEHRSVGPFHSIVVKGHGRVVLHQGDDGEVDVTTSSDLLEAITTQVDEGVLTLMTKEEVHLGEPIPSIVYHVVVSDLNHLSIGSSSHVISEGTLKIKDLSIVIQGAGMGHLNLEGDNLQVTMPEVGELLVSGQVNHQEVTLDAQGAYQALNLRSNTAELAVKHGGVAMVHVEDQLKVTISGKGVVTYQGSPNVIQKVTGGSVLSRMP